MAVYDINALELLSLYDISNDKLSQAYDYEGNIVFLGNDWMGEVTIEKIRDTSTNTNYYAVTVPQTRMDGNKQYPFLYAPNGIGQATESTLTMNRRDGFYLAINAGVGGTYPISKGVLPIGCLIENRVLLQQGNAPNYPILTIDENGYLDCAEPNTDGQTLILNGVVSALVGFFPIVVNYAPVDPSVYESVSHSSQHAQRQIIGQKENGDYVILTCEGRNFDNSTGWTIPEAINIAMGLNLRFAYNLDGGGSTETVIGNEQLNTIYENETGRKVQNYIVFNGTDEFFIPNA